MPSLTSEAQRMAKKFADEGLRVKLLGGLAIWMTCPSAQLKGLARSYGDLDFIAPKKEVRTLNKVFIANGCVEQTTAQWVQRPLSTAYRNQTMMTHVESVLFVASKQTRFITYAFIFRICHAYLFGIKL